MFFIQGRSGKNNWGLYLVSIFLVLFAYSIGQVPLMTVVSHYLKANNSSTTIVDFFADPDFASIGMSSNLGLLLMLLMFVAAFLALWVAVKYLHKKRFIALISPDKWIDYRRIAFGFIVWLILMALGELVLYIMDPQIYTYTFNGKAFLGLLAISFLILPIQTSFEELFFRGYLLQGLYNLIANKWVVVIITSLLFMAVHSTNPEIEQFGFEIMMTYYFLAGVLLGVVTMLDDRLELALGMHAAMNIYGAIFVGYEGGVIQTDSIWKMTEMNAFAMVVLVIIAGIVFILLAKRNFGWSFSVKEDIPIA
jgi:membrane protease YdiL (CAAX protease family)